MCLLLARQIGLATCTSNMMWFRVWAVSMAASEETILSEYSALEIIKIVLITGLDRLSARKTGRNSLHPNWTLNASTPGNIHFI